MAHRALATILFLVSFGCGFDAAPGDPPPPVAIPDGDVADGGATAEALVAEQPPVVPTVAAPVAAAAPAPNEAVENVLADAAPADPAPARLHTADLMQIYHVLPAMSADGRLIMTARYEEATDSIYVNLVRASNGRRIRSLPIALSSDGGESPDDTVAAVDRILERRGFVTFHDLDEVRPEDPDAETWDGFVRQWTKDDLAVHYDRHTGGLAVYREYRLLHQSLVPAQVPDGAGVGLMDPAYAALPMIPSADHVRISADGTTLAIRLGACDCSCDIKPFWKLIRL